MASSDSGGQRSHTIKCLLGGRRHTGAVSRLPGFLADRHPGSSVTAARMFVCAILVYQGSWSTAAGLVSSRLITAALIGFTTGSILATYDEDDEAVSVFETTGFGPENLLTRRSVVLTTYCVSIRNLEQGNAVSCEP